MSETPRIFVKKEYINLDSGIVTIADKDEIHYLKNVHRAKVNDNVIILDGINRKYDSTILNIEKDLIETKIANSTTLKKYPKTDITLIQGFVKGDKQEFIVQKATELGVKSIICVSTDYSNIKINDTKALNNKLNRMQKVALAASKQSKRSTIPEISISKDLKETVNKINTNNKDTLKIVCLESEENKTIKSVLKSRKNDIKEIFIFIGPEGGWSEREKALFQKQSIESASLGANILRAETSAIMAIGYLLYEYEFE